MCLLYMSSPNVRCKLSLLLCRSTTDVVPSTPPRYLQMKSYVSKGVLRRPCDSRRVPDIVFTHFKVLKVAFKELVSDILSVSVFHALM